MNPDSPSRGLLELAPPGVGEHRARFFRGASDVLAVAGVIVTLYVIAGAPVLGPVHLHPASLPVRGLLAAGLLSLGLVVASTPIRLGERRAQVRVGLISLGGLSGVSLAGDPRYAAIVVLLLVGLEAGRGGAISPGAREQAAGAFLLGIGTVLLEVHESSVAQNLGVLGVVLGLIAIAGLFPMVRQRTLRAPAAEGDVSWLALVSPILVLIVASQVLATLPAPALLVYGALTIAFGVLNLGWGVLGAWRATNDLVAWRFLFLADWGLALIGLGSVVPGGAGTQGAFLILVQILLVRFPLHELAQARAALGEPRRAGGLSVLVGAVLCGLPPFAGFAARFYLLRASNEVGGALTVPLLLGLFLWLLLTLRTGRT
ncbi:MAG: hypothetical protein J2P38_10440, partial [Candidatus Dormibacteraeota bacterium]|nr:hypothetical protein [Candidatus Dormibacteraeota bacterium]